MEQKSTLGIIIIAAVALLLGAVLVGIIADQTVNKTQKQVYSETFDLSALGVKLGNYTINSSVRVYPTHFLEATSGWRFDDEHSDDSGCSADDLTTSITAVNGSGTALVDPTDFVRVTSGYITFKDTLKLNGTGNTTTITMPYCADDYIVQSWQRSVFNMVPGFYALGVLIVAAFILFWILKREGIDF